MAKKRAGQTGKGTSEEKGKGIDLLFGGTPEEETEDEAGTSFAPPSVAPATLDAVPIESLPTPVETPAPSQPPPTSGELVDEFGLPLAMEAPPADLELAAPTAFPETEVEATEDLDTPDLATDITLDDLEGLDDLTLDLSDEDLSGLAGEDLSGLNENLSDLDNLGEIDGEVSDVTKAPTETSQLPVIPTDVTPSPTIPEPFPATPVPVTTPSQPDPVFTPEPDIPFTPDPIPAPEPSFPPQSTSPSVTTMPASSTTSPPVTPTSIPVSPPLPPTPSIAPPRARIDSIGGIVSEKIQVVEKDILPDDTTYSGGPVSGVLALADRAQIERDELITQKVTRYIGRERRENLDKEIENLYDEVARELSVNTGDTEFALRTLSQAQDIIFEDARQYDEALYRVAVVRTMITRKRNLRRWSYTWGSAVFFYAVIWLTIFIAGFLFTDLIREQLDKNSGATQAAIASSEENTVTTENGETVTLNSQEDATIVDTRERVTSDSIQAVRAAWFSALAGGIGGVIGILYSLYWHVAMKQDFDRQYVMYYVVQPVMGFILGAVVHFIIGAGFLFINFASTQNTDAEQVLSSSTVVSLQVVLGWISGFRQRFVFEMIDKIVQKWSPRGEEETESKEPVSVVPADQLGSLPRR